VRRRRVRKTRKRIPGRAVVNVAKGNERSDASERKRRKGKRRRDRKELRLNDRGA
jgi:hypothetical protein